MIYAYPRTRSHLKNPISNSGRFSSFFNQPPFTLTEPRLPCRLQPPPPFEEPPQKPTGWFLPRNHLLITASFGRILPSYILRLFPPKQCLNVHPSILPSYRGASPIQYAILSGERETGVSVIEMMEPKKGIDSGAIFGCEKMVRNEWKFTLSLH